MDGPWVRLTADLIPGLGTSPNGQRYSFRDAGLRNGATYFYRLEDIDRYGSRHVARARVRNTSRRSRGARRGWRERA